MRTCALAALKRQQWQAPWLPVSRSGRGFASDCVKGAPLASIALGKGWRHLTSQTGRTRKRVERPSGL